MFNSNLPINTEVIDAELLDIDEDTKKLEQNLEKRTKQLKEIIELGRQLGTTPTEGILAVIGISLGFGGGIAFEISVLGTATLAGPIGGLVVAGSLIYTWRARVSITKTETLIRKKGILKTEFNEFKNQLNDLENRIKATESDIELTINKLEFPLNESNEMLQKLINNKLTRLNSLSDNYTELVNKISRFESKFIDSLDNLLNLVNYDDSDLIIGNTDNSQKKLEAKLMKKESEQDSEPKPITITQGYSRDHRRKSFLVTPKQN